jgi:hypothetical protein
MVKTANYSKCSQFITTQNFMYVRYLTIYRLFNHSGGTLNEFISSESFTFMCKYEFCTNEDRFQNVGNLQLFILLQCRYLKLHSVEW